MIAVFVCVAIALGSANGQAAKYPAGVNPHLCPNYPHCDNAVLGAAAAHAAPFYGANVAVGYPAGVSPHACPNYPYCGPVPSKAAYGAHHGWAAPAAWAAPVVHGAAIGYGFSSLAKGGDRYPAGVSPHACPNYPYCH